VKAVERGRARALPLPASWRTGRLLAILPLVSGLTFADAPTLDVSANRDRIYLGESFLLEVKVGGTSRPDTPDLSGVKDCKVEFLGSRDISHQSFNFDMRTGQIRREGFSGRQFTYRLTPTRAGAFIAGPVSVKAEGTDLTRAGPAITVTGIARQDIVSIAVIPSRDAVLVDEPFEIRLVVRVRRLPGAFADVDPMLPSQPPSLTVPFLNPTDTDGLTVPDVRALLNARLQGGDRAGFAINDYTVENDPFDFGFFFNRQRGPARFKLDRQAVTENGTAYWEYGLTLPYTAVSEGPYTFGPVVFKGNVPVRVSPQGEAQTTEIFAVGPAAIVRVIPPPEENRPDSYVGAIGSNLTVTAALDAQTCNVGDPLKLTLTIGGNVQMRNVYPPKLSLQTNLLSRFEVYDDSVQAAKLDGNRQYAYTLRPRAAGAAELPPVDVSYYDVRDRQYRTVSSAPIPLKVRQAAEVTASQVIGGATNITLGVRREEQTAMQPAGVRVDPTATQSVALLGHTAPVAILLLGGPAIFVAALPVRLYRRHRASFRRFRRQRRALTRARHSLRMSAQAAEGHHLAVCRVLRQYLSERLDVPADAATPDEVRQLLADHGVPEEQSRRFGAVMQAHFNAAFGTAIARDLKEVEAVLKEVETSLRNARGRQARVGCWTLLTVLFAPALFGGVLPEDDFVWSEASARMASARTPADFFDAAAIYQKLVDRGLRSPALFYNQGTALLLANKPDDAMQVLKRAERYGATAPDLRRNLAIAQGRKDGLKAPVTPWNRIVLFWHYGLPCGIRATAAAAALALLWAAAALRLLDIRRAAKLLAIPALVVFIVFGSSVLTTLQQESNASRPAALRPPLQTAP
jgi:hypothetical protein